MGFEVGSHATHALPAFLQGHFDGLTDGIGHPLKVVGIDDEGTVIAGVAPEAA